MTKRRTLMELIEDEATDVYASRTVTYRFHITKEMWSEFYNSNWWYNSELEDKDELLQLCAEYWFCTHESELDVHDEDFDVRVDY